MKVGVSRYFRHSKISEARFLHLLRCFALDLTATQTAAVTGISVRSANAVFLRMRRRMAEACERDSPSKGVVEANESYFGPRRVRSRSWRRDDHLRAAQTRQRSLHRDRA